MITTMELINLMAMPVSVVTVKLAAF